MSLAREDGYSSDRRGYEVGMRSADSTGRPRGHRRLWGCLGGALLAGVVVALVVGLSWWLVLSQAAAFGRRREVLVSIVRSRATVEEARQIRGRPGRLVAKPADP